MKKVLMALAILTLTAGTSCEKDNNDSASVSCNLPSTSVPASMVGNWASGFNSSTQIVNAYNGQMLGNAWQSGKYFSFSADGKHAEFYYMANAGLNFSTATKAIGTVTFNEQEGSFVFHACQGHYRGWQNGTMTVDRDATPAELDNNLTQKYFYSFTTTGGTTWMQIRFDPAGSPSSFTAVP
ncbi:MAG TPA: hypothetical protein PKL81_13485 [Ferruginibacter sp.]|nr:hypothetical protein [Ferruginibacter sp.]